MPTTIKPRTLSIEDAPKYSSPPAFNMRSRDSSVGIATGYGLDDQGEREFEFR
jgi:hypothetical protein